MGLAGLSAACAVPKAALTRVRTRRCGFLGLLLLCLASQRSWLVRRTLLPRLSNGTVLTWDGGGCKPAPCNEADIIERIPFETSRFDKPSSSLALRVADMSSPSSCAQNEVWKSGLDPTIWLSTVSPTTHQQARGIPSGCRVSHVFVDGLRVFLVPVPSMEEVAVRDLYDCCLSQEGSCGRSVSISVCECFAAHKPVISKLAPTVWLGGHAVGRQHKRGPVWLANHWSWVHHPAHFAYKLLEFHGRFATRCAHDHQTWMPDNVVTFLSLDYPLDWPLGLTDYERFVIEIVRMGTNVTTFGTASSRESCWRDGTASEANRDAMNARLEAIRGLCHDSSRLGLNAIDCQTTLKKANREGRVDQRIAHCTSQSTVIEVEEAYFTPFCYSSCAIPDPMHLSRQALQQTVSRLRGAESPCINGVLPKHPRITIVKRIEGTGFRAWLNEEAVLLAIAEETGVSTFTWATPFSKTSALDQLEMFTTFDILVTPHSSQLVNLLFAPANRSVIEMQAARQPLEKSFLLLSDQSNLHHQVIRSNVDGDTDGRVRNWALWDLHVNIADLRIALRRAMANLRLHGIIAAPSTSATAATGETSG